MLFFPIFAQNLFLNFQVLTIGMYRGTLKVIENVVGGFIICVNAPKTRIENVIFAE